MVNMVLPMTAAMKRRARRVLAIRGLPLDTEMLPAQWQRMVYDHLVSGDRDEYRAELKAEGWLTDRHDTTRLDSMKVSVLDDVPVMVDEMATLLAENRDLRATLDLPCPCDTTAPLQGLTGATAC